MTFTVTGPPATKGSGRAYTYRKRDGTTGVRVAADNEAALEAWAACVRLEALAARQQTRARCIPRPVGVRLEATFHLARPLALQTPRYQAGRVVTPPHTVKPDLDKLTRAIGDALTGVVYEDDAQIVTLVAAKRYAGIGEFCGVSLIVEALDYGGPKENTQADDRQSAQDCTKNCEARRRR